MLAPACSLKACSAGAHAEGHSSASSGMQLRTHALPAPDSPRFCHAGAMALACSGLAQYRRKARTQDGGNLQKKEQAFGKHAFGRRQQQRAAEELVGLAQQPRQRAHDVRHDLPRVVRRCNHAAARRQPPPQLGRAQHLFTHHAQGGWKHEPKLQSKSC